MQYKTNIKIKDARGRESIYPGSLSFPVFNTVFLNQPNLKRNYLFGNNFNLDKASKLLIQLNNISYKTMNIPISNGSVQSYNNNDIFNYSYLSDFTFILTNKSKCPRRLKMFYIQFDQM